MDTFAFVFVVLICWSIIALNDLFPHMNRPEIFRGMRGEWLLFVLMTATTVSTGSALIWMLLAIWWLKVPAIILLGAFAGNWAYGKLPLMLNGTAIGPVLWGIGLVVANFTAWSVLRP